MKIFMYSDLHISKTSSILPLSSDEIKYTYRQNMVIETGKYLAEIIKKEQPNLIINLGDTFDQHTITSYDTEIASEFFKCFNDLHIPHFVLVGNHDMLNYDFNVIAMLKNVEGITVIKDPISIPFENTTLSFMPYREYKDILSFPDGDFLFSHIDIMGMKIRGDYELPEGISIEQLSKYKLVFNGHIHKPSIKGNIVNVGSISTHSFSDDNDAVPQCYIFDTETLNLQTFKPNMCPLFRKVEIKTEDELTQYLNSINKDYKYILQVICPFEIKEIAKTMLLNNEFVIAHKLSVKVDNVKKEQNDISNEIQANIDIKKSFLEFLNTVDDLKYPKSLYENILKEVD